MLNKITVKNKCLISNTDEFFNQLNSVWIFSKLDLKSGYHQVRIKAGDKPKMMCVMRYGSYKFTVMSFGLSNTLTTFCALINHVFCAFLTKCVII